MKLGREDALACLNDIRNLENCLADREWANGVSQDSSEQKDKAFARLSDWMSSFYAAARLILKKEPELLDALYSTA